MNVVSLDFRTVTLLTLAAMLALGLFVAAVMPPQAHRTRETDALEFALVTLLTVIFSPLSFNYAYVWLMYPTALALHRVLGDPLEPPARPRRLALAWLAAVLFIPALAIAMPQTAQAVGNLFVPALLLVFGLGWMLRAEGLRSAGPGSEELPDHAAHQRSRGSARQPALSKGNRCGAPPGAVSDCVTLALPFSGLRPTMPPSFRRGIQREGTRRMEGSRMSSAGRG